MGEIIPFPVWMIPFPVLKINCETLGTNEKNIVEEFLENSKKSRRVLEIIQTGNEIISPTSRPKIKKLILTLKGPTSENP